MTQKKLIIANWKCNPISQKETILLLETLQKGMAKISKTEVVICPPFVYLLSFKFQSADWRTSFNLGAQDCHWENKGTYTGAVSPAMLKDLGCQYVLIGHSERRKYFGETDLSVNLKLKAALKSRLIPVLCIGEQSRSDEKGEVGKVVGEQLKNALAEIPASRIAEIVIAYEPVWAISSGVVGSGAPCLPEDALKAALFIRSELTKMHNRRLAEKVKIIYGGSVTSKNAADYLKEIGISGVLVGGASLNASEFIKLAESVEGL
jgi:triosephosphate isomerase